MSGDRWWVDRCRRCDCSAKRCSACIEFRCGPVRVMSELKLFPMCKAYVVSISRVVVREADGVIVVVVVDLTCTSLNERKGQEDG